MEVQAHIMHHNPYDIVKEENPDSPDKIDTRMNDYSFPVCPTSDLIFGVGNFALQGNFCTQNNNNHGDQMNNNHVKMSNGRNLAADRKRPYPCNLCPSRFGSKMELEEHQNSHTGMKPFECDVCHSRFNRRSTLWNHKRIHSDAKPFVCTVCQMTFKWKNSLKCHKEMHQRKNESSAHLDHDLKQLTYATAAKRRLQQDQEEAGVCIATSSASSIHSQPLITTTTPKKKAAKSSSNALSTAHLNALANQPLQASSLIPPSDHQLDLDTSSLDTLVNTNHSNLLLHMYGEMEAPRHATSMLSSGMDDQTMLGNHGISDGKSESPMGGAPAPINVHLPMQINMFNFRPLHTQLPSVHHLTSTSLPSVSVDYGSQSDNLSQPHYIVTAQPEMMIGQHGLGYQQPFQLDQCVLLATGQDYVPNFDHYQMLSTPYQMPDQDQQQMVQQQAPQVGPDDEKVLPYEQW